MRKDHGAMIVIIAGIAALGPTAAIAAPLDAPACEQLQSRVDALRKEGVDSDMAQGPAWAKANLTPTRLQRIGEYLDAEEQLNFRCGIAKAKIVLPTTIEGGEEELPAPGEATVEGSAGTLPLPLKAPRKSKDSAKAPKAKAPKSAATKAAPGPARAPKKAAGGKSSENDPPIAKKKAPTPKRAKADDAYRPVRPTAGTEPPARQ